MLATADNMRVVQTGDLTHDLHLSIFPSLVSDRRSEPIINLVLILFYFVNFTVIFTL